MQPQKHDFINLTDTQADNGGNGTENTGVFQGGRNDTIWKIREGGTWENMQTVSESEISSQIETERL
ncbi:MAG: hypothetical protein LUC90_06400 [Lachnospiraceae bacterium]|nr:hypothetical protein [Lachnospiraceae bacterium]